MKHKPKITPTLCGKLRRTLTLVIMVAMAFTLCTCFASAAGMDFFNDAIDVLQTLVIAVGAGLAVWGAVNLMEGYGGDNPAAKSQGMKQLMAGAGVALIGILLVPSLSDLFTTP